LPISFILEFMDLTKSHLFDILYGYEPMTRGLAEEIKRIRCDSGKCYEDIPPLLNVGFGTDFALGKGLCELAKLFLKDTDPRWS